MFIFLSQFTSAALGVWALIGCHLVTSYETFWLVESFSRISFIHVSLGSSGLTAARLDGENDWGHQRWRIALRNSLTYFQSETTFGIHLVGITMSELWRLSFCMSGSLFITFLSLAIANSSLVSHQISHQMSHDLIHPPQIRSKAQRHRNQTNSTRIQIDLKG